MSALFGGAQAAMLGLCLAIGATALATGWWGVSGTAQQADQWTWLNVALGGMIVSGTGIGVWLLSASRQVTRFRQAVLPGVFTPCSAPTLAAVARSVTAARMTRYHRPDCVLMAGKQSSVATEAVLRPCGLCHPDREDGQ